MSGQHHQSIHAGTDVKKSGPGCWGEGVMLKTCEPVPLPMSQFSFSGFQDLKKKKRLARRTRRLDANLYRLRDTDQKSSVG